MYIGQAKHPIFNGGTFGIISAESPEHPVHVQGGNPAMASAMEQMGLSFEPTTGKYTNPENSFVVHGATAEQLHGLAKQFGQTAFIHSEGGRHRFHYANGPNEGKWHEADEQNPVEHFEQPPADMYTTVPGGHGHFRIAFKWDKFHGNDVAKSYSVEEAIALLLKSTGNLVKTLPALAAPALHPTVEGFMGGFRALPKDGPTRGKFITQHMNHGPFLSALQAHPQGKQIHSQLTSFLNSKVNAGPGKAVATVKSMLEKSDLTANVAALRAESQYKPHPHNYEWHDGHTSHHEVVDHAMPGLPGLAKAQPNRHLKCVECGHRKDQHSWDDGCSAHGCKPHKFKSHAQDKQEKGDRRHQETVEAMRAQLNKTELAKNDQAAGAGVSTYARYAVPFGNVVPGKQSNLLHYDYHQKLPDVEKLVHDHGYKTYYAGGKYGKPDLANKNYNTGHLMVYDPTPASVGDFGHETYTKAWRQIHELAHALTYPELNKTYGEGRRIGKLGVHRSLHEALRAVHWEHLAAHKQRELSAQIGVPLTDEQFHKEYNTVMHDAIHRAVTGQFTEPGAEGFVPHGRAIPLHHSLQMVRDAANEMGLNGLHQKLTKALPPHENSLATADALQEQGFGPASPHNHLYRRGVIPSHVKIPFPLQNKRAGAAEKLLPFGVKNPVANDVAHAPMSRDPDDSNYGGQSAQPILGNAEADALGQDLNRAPIFNDENSTAQNIPTKDAMLEAFARSPIMRMKKSGLTKAWPKDETENLDNAKGFLNSPVAQDAFLEQKPATFQEAPEAHSMPDRSEVGESPAVHPETLQSGWNTCRNCGEDWDMEDPTETLCPDCAQSDGVLNVTEGDTQEPAVSWGHQKFGVNGRADKGADKEYWRRIDSFTNTLAATGGDIKATSAAQIPTQQKMLATAKRSPVFRHQAEGWKLGKNEGLSKARPPHEDLLVTADALQEQGFKPTPGFATKQGLGTRLNSVPLAAPEKGLPAKRHGESYDPYMTRVIWDMPEGGQAAADRISEAAQSRYDNPTGAVPETTFGPREPGRMYNQVFTSGDRVNDKKYWQRMGTEPAVNPTLGIAAPDREAWARSPIMRMKKSELAKALPKTRKENAQNEAYHNSAMQVVEDRFLEQGGKKTEHGPDNQAVQLSNKVPGNQEGTPEYERAEAARWDNSMDALNYDAPPGLRRGAFALGLGVGRQPHATIPASVPNGGWYIDGARDREYWEAVDSEPAVGPGRQLLPSFHDTPVSNATKNILRSRSPVAKRAKLGKSDLMPGGKGDNKPDTDFDHEELAAGIRAEASEHGLDLARAKEVAKDHLTEDPKYYTKLRTMEKAK